ncbi:hypothetical protein [Labrenzia sp. MBR-25]
MAEKNPHQKTYPRPFSIRLSDSERARLKVDARGEPLARYIRTRLFGEAKPQKRHIANVLGLLGQSGIADNLAQLSAEAKAGSLLLDQETMDKIDQACAHVAQMRLELIRALGLGGKGVQ